jgi:anti-sigma-K factor RskA
MTEDEAKELGALYAVGALDEAASREYEEYLRGASAKERREVEEWREAAALLPLALARPALRPEVKDRLLARVQGEAAPQTVIPFAQPLRPAPPARWLPIAAALALAALSLFLFWENLGLRREREALAGRVDQQGRDLADRERQLAELVSPETRVAQLSGAAAPQATAQAFWDTARQQLVIYIYNLPSIAADQDYQLWFLTDRQEAISAGIFRIDARGRSEIRISIPQNVAPRLAGTAVSLEPSGGSPQPTGKIYLQGKV